MRTNQCWAFSLSESNELEKIDTVLPLHSIRTLPIPKKEFPKVLPLRCLDDSFFLASSLLLGADYFSVILVRNLKVRAWMPSLWGKEWKNSLTITLYSCTTYHPIHTIATTNKGKRTKKWSCFSLFSVYCKGSVHGMQCAFKSSNRRKKKKLEKRHRTPNRNLMHEIPMCFRLFLAINKRVQVVIKDTRQIELHSQRNGSKTLWENNAWNIHS